MHLAAATGNVRACAALIALGADLAAAAQDGATPLHRWDEGGGYALEWVDTQVPSRGWIRLGFIGWFRLGKSRCAAWCAKVGLMELGRA